VVLLARPKYIEIGCFGLIFKHQVSSLFIEVVYIAELDFINVLLWLRFYLSDY